MKTKSDNSKSVAARRRAIKALKTSEAVDCLNERAYVAMLVLKVELVEQHGPIKLARLVKAWKGEK